MAERERLAEITNLDIRGMNCANCVQHVTRALRGVPGVESAEVFLSENRAHVYWRNGFSGSFAELSKAVSAAGYKANLISSESLASRPLSWRFNVLMGLAGFVPIVMGEWLLGSPAWFRWTSFFLAAFVQAVGGARFYFGAWRQLRRGASNMDTLVVLGSTSAFVYSAWLLFSGQPAHLYFMESTAILTLISAGHWLEQIVTGRAEKSLRALFQLAPTTAMRQESDGAEKEVPVSQLQKGDRVILRPGSRVPTEGIVAQGEANMDESALTGEALPAVKRLGGQLFAGTLNLDGHLIFTVTGVGQETAMAQIVAAVRRAQTSRAGMQRLADRVSNIFVPVVVALALFAGVSWAWAYPSLLRIHNYVAHYFWAAHVPGAPLSAGVLCAVAVLIVACPCAMGLATPVALLAGTQAAARRGLLIRDAVALEKAGSLTAVLLDKTGTLTEGRPEVVDEINLSSETNHLSLAAALARGSGHPLSVAIAALADGTVNLSHWREIRGSGVEAEWTVITGRTETVRLGSLAWLGECGVSNIDKNGFTQKWTEAGASVLGLAQGQNLTALFALRDRPKPHLREALAQLEKMGLKTLLVTGDNTRTAQALAAQCGIPRNRVFAELKPEQKAELVARLQREGEKVAFVGDGINDAPALEQADLGVAVSRASDIAHEAADIVLLRSDIAGVPEAIALARASLRVIRQNLFWAFFYNAAAIPLAAAGFLSPLLCAGAMGLSDLVVIGNAARLSLSIKHRCQGELVGSAAGGRSAGRRETAGPAVSPLRERA